MTGNYAEAEWAWHNAISNGGNAHHLWRTLTKDEWNYLLNIRDNASSKHGRGNINGVGGLIILPDNWTLPSGYTFNTGLSSSDGWALNSYTLSQWAVMEDAGAVFLPAAGCRWGTSVSFVGSEGYYWSTTHRNGSSAHFMGFTIGGYLTAMSSNSRSYGRAVRPVRDIE